MGELTLGRQPKKKKVQLVMPILCTHWTYVSKFCSYINLCSLCMYPLQLQIFWNDSYIYTRYFQTLPTSYARTTNDIVLVKKENESDSCNFYLGEGKNNFSGQFVSSLWTYLKLMNNMICFLPFVTRQVWLKTLKLCNLCLLHGYYLQLQTIWRGRYYHTRCLANFYCF